MIVAVGGQKGGTGKTTTAVSLAAILAGELERPTLLIDLDPQGGASAHLDAEGDPGIAAVLEGEPWEPSIYPTPVEGLDVCPGNTALAPLEASGGLSATVLRDRLEALPPGRYQDVVIDCHPSLGLLVIAALTAAELVLVPVECRPLAYRGVGAILEVADTVRAEWNRKLTAGRVLILPTRLDRRTSISPGVLEALRDEYGERVLPAIPENAALSTASAYRQPISLYQRSAPGAKAYRELAGELVNRG